MLRDASQRKFDVLVFWALDRFSREGVTETLNYLQRLTSFGVEWRSHTEQYLDSCGVFREAVLAILAVIAKQERVRLRERVLAGLDRAREKGTRSGKPVGRPRVILRRDQLRQNEAMNPAAIDEPEFLDQRIDIELVRFREGRLSNGKDSPQLLVIGALTGCREIPFAETARPAHAAPRVRSTSRRPGCCVCSRICIGRNSSFEGQSISNSGAYLFNTVVAKSIPKPGLRCAEIPAGRHFISLG